MDKQELYKETHEAMAAIYEQWGDVRTPFGHIWRIGLTWGWSSPITSNQQSISIESPRWPDCYASEASMDAVLRLVGQTLPAMANYLASEDFTNKVKGSIRRLKAIIKALQA